LIDAEGEEEEEEEEEEEGMPMEARRGGHRWRSRQARMVWRGLSSRH
jgi:hypothetical protein